MKVGFFIDAQVIRQIGFAGQRLAGGGLDDADSGWISGVATAWVVNFS
jgi:hypothetical protein